ncbi:pyrroline-5-carboxylate reductase [Lampropedia puyangensis]|uniref:Pyrroline-5-carboxylate reductase n=1 Tax=Lampropedia puyangensis TaxID=1330072 RepID=A0A4S8FD26_9BURK|nr:pyrroline-5-carboxylate reductase [Lampropedia puyangensis]THU04504.1 pyrroline-5-carboxylate reductase [Lampropedia puyangensis]
MRTVLFVGGGNMARAIIGGLIHQGKAPSDIRVIEPDAQTRAALTGDFSVQTQEEGSPLAHGVDLVVWAVKPQVLKSVMHGLAGMLADALHVSIAAGVTTASIGQWLGSQRIVRAMPNTPALIGKGITGVFAGDAVEAGDRQASETVLQAVGQVLWVEREAQLDAVTALSGSGPAYVFYFLEAMQQAGTQLGLTAEQAYQLAVATFEGASALAAQSTEAPEVLRQRVTSKGGTTFAATTALDALDVKPHFVAAMQACHDRAVEMAQEFGK